MKKLIFLMFAGIILMGFQACDDDDSSSNEICNNAMDDDGDNLIDCADPDCVSYIPCATNNATNNNNNNNTTCDGTAPLADLQDGVCGDAHKICADGTWIEPDYSLILGYEAVETSCDEMDNNCDGAVDENDVCLIPVTVQTGDLVVTEIMISSSLGDNGQFIEIYNPTIKTIDLSGVGIKVTTALQEKTLVINDATTLEPNEFIIITKTKNTTQNGGMNVNFEFLLLPSMVEEFGQIEIFNNANSDTIDVVTWDDSWNHKLNSSLILTPPAFDGDMSSLNNNKYHWCFSKSIKINNSVNNGTPGELNEECKVGFCEVSPPEKSVIHMHKSQSFVSEVFYNGKPSLATIQTGYGVTTSSPDDSWSWVNGEYSSSLDETQFYSIDFPVAATGVFDLATRISIDGGLTWEYCDTYDSEGYFVNDIITIKVYDFIQITSGIYHRCGLTSDKNTYCWGSIAQGQSVLPVLPVNTYFTTISSGDAYTCGITNDSSTICWGFNGDGQTDVPLLPVNTYFTTISSGGFHSCGITNDSSTICWGRNNMGQLDVPVLPVNTYFRYVSSGFYHTCGLTNDSSTICWGYNTNGQSDVPVLPVNTHFIHVSMGYLHTCGITNDGSTICWGSNTSNQLDVPQLPGGTYFTWIRSGLHYNCGVTNDNKSYCWGSNDYGETDLPVLPLNVYFTDFSGHRKNTCGITNINSAYCWGEDNIGYGLNVIYSEDY
jgi:Lamin Tail Domain/Regulator of chromosome condensation (RCC1) repeat